MSSNGVKPFENNWAYLKTELRWLDRLLMLAVSRQRNDEKTLSRVGNAPVDKVTSHWWKGIIAVNRGIDDREGPPPRQSTKPTPTISYSQHLESRIRASHQAGISLALPQLRDRCSLTEVEKNILLMAIAPEINRRYGRLYDYLQADAGALTDLPTVDLCLRLLCRNDHDWQRARARLTATDSLVQWGLVEWIGDEDGTLLSQQVRVTDEVVNYLLADIPPADALQTIVEDSAALNSTHLTTVKTATESTASHTASPPQETASASTADATSQVVVSRQVEASWDHLVMPKTLIRQLQHLGRQAAQRGDSTPLPGLIVLMVGAPGTGKTTAAATVAAQLSLPLTCVELNTLTLESYPDSLTDPPTENSSLLLVKQAELWFGRQPKVDQTWLHQWWQWRKQLYGLTLVTVQALQTVKPSWRQRFDGIVTLPQPDSRARRRLWEQAFAETFDTQKIDWVAIAKQLPLTGGEITAIAATIQLDLKAQGKSTVTRQALKDALKLHHPHLAI